MSRLRGFFTYTFIFIIGGLVFGALELLFRGRTHWSMLITGGLCVMCLYTIAAKSRVPAWKKWLTAGALITTVEFIAGVFVNIMLGWDVWDYSGRRMNLMGQICPLFTVIWTLLSIPAMRLFERVESSIISKGERGI